jgi:hypothetical protein
MLAHRATAMTLLMVSKELLKLAAPDGGIAPVYKLEGDELSRPTENRYSVVRHRSLTGS